MKKHVSLLVFLIVIITSLEVYSQVLAGVLTGRLVDENGAGLPDISLQLFVSPNIFTTSSLSDGRFYFNVLTGIESDVELPSGYIITNNFPNPFNPITRIGITVPKDALVNVKIFNILGQKVMEEIEKYFYAGTQFLDIELYGLPSGIYFAQISIDQKYTTIKKMMLVYGSQHLSDNNNIQNSILPEFNNSVSVILDSLVAFSSIIGRKSFTNLPGLDGDTTDLGNLKIERQCPGLPTITYEGKIYNTIFIGDRCWLTENLDVGTLVQGNQDQTNNETIEKYCYNNDPNNCNFYGGLYQWNEAMQYSTTPGTQGICPPGWHIPTMAEFDNLRYSALHGDGNALKAIGQGTGYGAGTNTSGFSALLGGYRHDDGSFIGLGSYVAFWSSIQYYGYARYIFLLNNDGYISEAYYNKTLGYPVRCLKD